MVDSTRKTILLVEDDGIIALAEKTTLESYGYEAIVASDGEKAVSLVRDRPVDLILMDIDLGPGRMDGKETAQRILDEVEVPIVFLTSHSERDMVERVRGITRYGYVLKSSGEFVLLQSIAMALELFESASQLGMYFNTNPAGTTVWEARGDDLVLTKVNRAAIRKSDGAITKFVGQTARQMYHDRPNIVEKFECVRKTGDPVEFEEFYHLRTSGNLEWLHFRVEPLGDTGVIAYADISTAAHAKDELIAQSVGRDEQLFSLVVDQFAFGVGYYTEDARIKFYNRHALKEIGLARGDVEGKHISELFPEAAARRYAERMRHVVETGVPHVYEDSVDLRDGPRWYRSVYSKILAPDGTPLGVAIVSVDETERRRGQIESRQNEARYRRLFELSVDAILVARGSDGTITEASPAAAILFGRPLREIVGVHHSDLYVAEDQDRADRAFAGRAEGTPVEQMNELRIERPDGSSRLVEIADIAYEEQGEQYIMGRFRDVTVELDQRERLEGLVRESELLLSETHHRVKNNMSTMVALLELQMATSSSDETVDALREAASRFRSMQVLYEQLYRRDSDDELPSADYLRRLVEEVGTSFSLRSGVRVQTDIEQFVIGVHELSLVGIAVNELIVNSFKHAFPDGRQGTVDVRAVRENGLIVVTVTDDGIGLPEDRSRLENGFGMETVHALAAQLGGEFSIEHTDRTVARLTFPAAASR